MALDTTAWDQTYDTVEDGVTLPRLALVQGQGRRVRLLAPITKSPAALFHEFRRESENGGQGWYTTALCWNNTNGPHGCPLCKTGRRASPRIFLIFWAYQATPQPRVEVWERSKGFVKKSLQPKENLGYDLTQQDLVIQKFGEGKATTYPMDVVPAKSEFVLPDATILQEQVNAIDWVGFLTNFLPEETLLGFLARERGEDFGGGTPPVAPPTALPAPPPPPNSVPPGGFAIQTE